MKGSVQVFLLVAKARYCYLPVSILVGNAIEIWYFMNSLLTNLIVPKIQSTLAKISSLKFMFKKPYLSQYLMDSNKEGLKI